MQYMEAMSEALDSLIEGYNSYNGQETKVVFSTGYKGRKITLTVDKNPEILQLLRNLNLKRVYTSALYNIVDKDISYYPLKLKVSFPELCDDNFNELDRIVRKISSAGINPVVDASNISWSTPKQFTKHIRGEGKIRLNGVNSTGKWKVNGSQRPEIHPSETIDLPESALLEVEGPVTFHRFLGGKSFEFIQNSYGIVSTIPLPDEVASDWESEGNRGAVIPSEALIDVYRSEFKNWFLA